jgi:hypothetical protein
MEGGGEKGGEGEKEKGLVAYCSIAVAIVVVADRLVAEIDAQLAAHDFVVVQISDG